jgi:uncharacterized protein (TIGR03086 family)
MALDLPEIHARCCDHTHGIVAGIADSQLGDDSVCEGWDVRELLNHVVSGNLWARELVGGKTIEDVGDRLDGDVLGADPSAAYDASAALAVAAFREPGAMERPVGVSYGPVPGEVYCGHRIIDVLVHGWDLAASTGQDTRLPEDLVEACWEITEPQLEMLTGSGLFRTDVEALEGADTQTVLLAALGRKGVAA